MIQKDREWIENHFDSLRREVVKVQIDIATLKVKAGIWGLIGGAIPVAAALGIYLLTRKLSG